jgi:proteasome lid subunit RPN8/RPN11
LKFIDNIRNLFLVLEDAVIDAISKQAIISYPNETGGFLVGKYINDCRTALVTDLVLPLKSESGPMSYKRDTDGMDCLWDELYKDGLIYLGEWHSHPDSSASYSNMDKQALTNIATSTTVVIRHPIMLISSVSKTRIREYRAYYYYNGQIIEYEQDRD